MIDPKILKSQLAAIDHDLPFWVRPELKELPRIIVQGEVVEHVVAGRYQGGFALLCATNQRVIVVDKKPLFLAVEDMRYDMVSEVNYTHQLMDATLHVTSFSKEVRFNSFKKHELRELTSYLQNRIAEIRNGVVPTTNDHIEVEVETDMSSEQARELLPNTYQAWDRVSDKLNTINSYGSSPTFIRRRVAKFDTFQ